MKDRKLELRDAASQFLSAKYEIHLEETRRYIDENKERLCINFSNEMRPFIDHVFQQQQEIGKKNIRYVFISSLFSSTVTKSYEYQIAFYDDAFYFDPIESCFYWSPNFIFNHVDEDIEQFADGIKEHIVCLRKHELEEIRQMYTNEHHIIAGLFFENTIIEVLKNSNIKKLGLEREVDIYFGIYMDRAVQIAQIKRDEIDL